MKDKLVAAVAILALGVGIWSYVQHRQAAQAQLAACVSTNVTRVTDNLSHLADYRLWEGQIKSDEQTQHTYYVALRKAGISKKVLAIALKHDRQQRRREEDDVATKVWTSLSDCAEPGSRNAELEVHSFSAGMPPKSALDIHNALKVTPAGSVSIAPTVTIKK